MKWRFFLGGVGGGDEMKEALTFAMLHITEKITPQNMKHDKNIKRVRE